MMKKLWIQLLVILVVSAGVGLAVNGFSRSPLPLFKTYQPDTDTDKATGEDLTAYFQEMDVETLDSLREAEAIILLDARTPDKYETAHIPGAISLPISTFSETYESVAPLLEDGKSLVLYCIGVHCIDSSLLARELYKKGRREIFVYKGGIEEWQAMGYPVQTPEGITGGSHETENH
jgi:rhodanese-related sulfurtransferase